MTELFQHMRTLLEGAPPLAYYAAAAFLKREEPRWTQLSEDAELLEERFYTFLQTPSSWDLVEQAIDEDGEGGAPANAAGNGGVAGIGQPPGSKFGEPGFALGGATTKTKKKNKRPDDLDEEAPAPFTYKGVRVVWRSKLDLWKAEVNGQWLYGEDEAYIKQKIDKAIAGHISKLFVKEDADKPRYSPTNRRNVGKLEIEFTRTRSNDMMGRLSTTYTAKTLIPSANGFTRSGAESKPAKTLGAAFEDLKDQLINRYYVTGTLSFKRSSYDNVVNAELEAFLRYQKTKGPITEAISDKEIEKAAEAVHNRWVKNQEKAGETEHKSPDGKEDYMVPYDELSNKSKEMDREAVKATLDTLKVDEDAKKWKRETCWSCSGHGTEWGDTCLQCGGRGVLWIDEKGNEHNDYEREEELNEASKVQPYSKHAKLSNMGEPPKRTDLKVGSTCEIVGAFDEAGMRVKITAITPSGYYTVKDKKGNSLGNFHGSNLKKLNEEQETFAGSPVFDVPMDRWMASRFGKKRYHRYSRYVGNDELGETIRQTGRKTKDDIVLKDQTTGVMTYLRRKAVKKL